MELWRIFTHDSLTKGGRFYRGWWQHVPSRHWHRIVINEELTAECDDTAAGLKECGKGDPCDSWSNVSFRPATFAI